MDAMGKDVIVVETVGVGQDEIDIAQMAHTTLLVTVPGMGDDIQAIKAGILEVADVFVVNKADRAGAHALMAELRFSVHLHYTTRRPNQEVDWEVPVLATEGANDVGIGELLEAIKRHRTILGETGALERRRQRRRRGEFEALLVEEFTAQVMARVRADPELTRTLDLVSSGGLDPYSAVAQILGRTLSSGSSA